MTQPANIGWAQLGIKKIGHCGGGPEAAKKCLSRSGVYHRARKRIALGTTAAEAGFGPIHLAQHDLISSVNIVSIFQHIYSLYNLYLLNYISEKMICATVTYKFYILNL